MGAVYQRGQGNCTGSVYGSSAAYYRYGSYGYWRSTDSGATWSDLSRALGQTFSGHDDPNDPTSDPKYGQVSISTFTSAPDDSYLLASAYHQPLTPGTGYGQLIRSTDGGSCWMVVPGEQGEYGAGQYNPVISPVLPRRAYRGDSKDPAYRIALGLLGQESLVARGWVIQPS